MGDVEHLPHFRVDRGIFGIGRRADPIQTGRSPAIQRGEQGDVDAARHQRLRQETRDLLPGPVVARRCTPGDRGQHGNTQTTILPLLCANRPRASTPSFDRSRTAPSSASTASSSSGQEQPAPARPIRQLQMVRLFPEIERHNQPLCTVPTLVGEYHRPPTSSSTKSPIDNAGYSRLRASNRR